MRTIIGLDVSKASTKLSVAVDGKTTYDGDITIDAIGFQSLKSIIQSYGGAEVGFEATGVYSRRLEKYLIDNGADVKIMDRLFWHREVPRSENFSKPGFQLKTA